MKRFERRLGVKAFLRVPEDVAGLFERRLVLKIRDDNVVAAILVQICDGGAPGPDRFEVLPLVGRESATTVVEIQSRFREAVVGGLEIGEEHVRSAVAVDVSRHNVAGLAGGQLDFVGGIKVAVVVEINVRSSALAVGENGIGESVVVYIREGDCIGLVRRKIVRRCVEKPSFATEVDERVGRRLCRPFRGWRRRRRASRRCSDPRSRRRRPGGLQIGGTLPVKPVFAAPEDARRRR